MAIKGGWLRAQDEAESTMVSSKENQDWKRCRISKHFLEFRTLNNSIGSRPWRSGLERGEERGGFRDLKLQATTSI